MKLGVSAFRDQIQHKKGQDPQTSHLDGGGGKLFHFTQNFGWGV